MTAAWPRYFWSIWASADGCADDAHDIEKRVKKINCNAGIWQGFTRDWVGISLGVMGGKLLGALVEEDPY